VNDSINSLTQGVDAARETILGSGSFAADTGTRSESRSTSSSSSSSGSRTTRSSSVKPNPGSDYPNNNFFNFVRAQIISGSTKLLASPTLILQENAAELRGSEAGGGGGGQGNSGDSSTGGGLDEYTIDSPIGRRRANEGVVRVGVNVPTKVETTQNENSSSTSCTIEELTTAGLVLGARIEKIDDNGFVTFALSPSVSAVVDELPAGTGCPPISILAIRRLDTGALRVRDGQTLILTGVISESDRQVVNKWPILGDIPLIGQFFRATTSRKEKRELVIMVSPRIVNDDQGGVFGYGYQPSSAPVREFFGGASF
jgi:type IV pilus assembly protein PilQ